MKEMIDKTIIKKIEKDLTNAVKKGEVIVIKTSSKDYESLIDTCLYILTKKDNDNGIYVTLNSTYASIIEKMKKLKIKTSNLYFIDGISAKIGKASEAENCYVLQGPTSLTELSLSMTEAANTGKFQFILLDSLSTMLIYNDTKTTQRFANFILGKMKNLGMGGVVIALDEETSAKILPSLSSFCNKILEI